MGLLDRPGQYQRPGLLSPDVMRLIASGGPQVAPAPAAPRRERVSGWRVLDRVLGGQTVTGGLDAERERLEAQAMRPQMEARQAQLRQAAEAMGPAAMLAFDLNPEKFGEELASQFSPQVIAAGGIQSVIGNGQRVSAPQVTQFGDSLVRTDPLQPGPETLMQRGPTFQEQTARLSATSPVNVAPGNVLIDPQTGEQRGSGRGRILSAGEGVDLVSESGAPIYQNAPPPRAPVARPAAALEIEGRIDSTAREVVPSLNRMRQLLSSGDVITGLGADVRLQADRVLASAGNRDAQRRVAATEELRNLSGRLRVGMAKTLGANPSNADILLLEKITGGDISQSSESLMRLVDQGLQMSSQQQADLQRQLRAFDTQGDQGGGQPDRAAAAPAQGQPVRIYNDDDYARLPSGAMYQAPDGSVRRKS
jgi:hypothetical protein